MAREGHEPYVRPTRELTGLRVWDVQWARGSEGLRVQGKSGRWREVPLLPGMASRPLLRRLVQGKPAEAFVFPGRMERPLTVRAL